MKIHVDTPTGPRIVNVRGVAGVQRAIDLVFKRDLQIVGELPPLYECGVRYRRERRSGIEDFKGADRCLRDFHAGSPNGIDCDDLAPWRAAELVVSGVDPDAYPFVYQPRPRLMHVIVVRGDGTLEDPSAMLGMRNRKINAMQYRFRGSRGNVECGLAIPIAGEKVRARGHGASRAEAILDAQRQLSDLISGEETGAHKCGGSCVGCGSCACGECGISEVGIDASTGAAVVDQLGELAANVRAGNTAGVVAQLKAGAEIASKASGGGGGIDWEKAAQAAVTAGCAIGLAASGVAAWAAPACALIGPLWDAIKKWITVKISPDKDFVKEAEAKIPDLYAKGSYKRYRFVKVTKDKAQYDRDLSVRAADGWRPTYEWNKSYGKSYQWGSGKGTYYAAVFDRTSAPPELQEKWMLGGIRSLRALMLPKAQMFKEWGEAMRAQGGGGLPSLPLDFATAADFEAYRAAGQTRGLEIPAVAAPDSEIATNEGYGPLRPIFGLPAPELAAPSTGVTITPVNSGGRSNTGLQLRVGPGVQDVTPRSVVPAEPPLVAPITLDKLDKIRELGELARDGSIDRVRSIVRKGGPLGRLARELL